MTVTFPYSSAPVKQVKEIQFGVMSPEEIVSHRYKDHLCRPRMMAGTEDLRRVLLLLTFKGLSS